MLNHCSWTTRWTFGRLALLLAVVAIPMALAFGEKPPESSDKAPRPAVERRRINKRVRDFPEKVDLSTPESACAALGRSMARKDVPSVLNLCWVKLMDADMAKDVEDCLKHDPNAPKNSAETFLDAKIIEVLAWYSDCAAVIFKLDESTFGPGHGPYGAVVFARISGVWKFFDCGITASRSVQHVAASLESKKEDIQRRFVEVRGEVLKGRTPVVDEKSWSGLAGALRKSATSATSARPAESSEQSGVEKRAVDKLVKDFPEKIDLSTPESAFAAWTRSVARKDVATAVELSWVKLDSQATQDAIRDLLTHSPALPKDFEQQVLETRIVEVLIYNNDLAAVVTKSGLYPGKRSYAMQYFGRIDGVWKNLDWKGSGGSSSSPQAAEEHFAKKKDDQWQSFVKVRDDVRHGRTPIFKDTEGHMSAALALSAAEKEEIKRWQGETWQLGISLDMPKLEPQAVQYAVLDKDPLPRFIAQVEKMRKHNRQQLDKPNNEARKEQVRDIEMMVAWDLGFREITGDNLYLLTNLPDSGDFKANCLSSNGPDGKKWIVTKTVHVKGKPVCWCLPVEVKKGKQIDVTFDQSNTFDLRPLYDKAMAEPAGGADKKE